MSENSPFSPLSIVWVGALCHQKAGFDLVPGVVYWGSFRPEIFQSRVCSNSLQLLHPCVGKAHFKSISAHCVNVSGVVLIFPKLSLYTGGHSASSTSYCPSMFPLSKAYLANNLEVMSHQSPTQSYLGGLCPWTDDLKSHSTTWETQF